MTSYDPSREFLPLSPSHTVHGLQHRVPSVWCHCSPVLGVSCPRLWESLGDLLNLQSSLQPARRKAELLRRGTRELLGGEGPMNYSERIFLFSTRRAVSPQFPGQLTWKWATRSITLDSLRPLGHVWIVLWAPTSHHV